MSDCCPRADGYHGPDCAEWWEQAYSSEQRKRVVAESQVAALTASLASVTKESNRRSDIILSLNQQYDTQASELAELRKRIAELEAETWNCHECGMNHPRPPGPCPDLLASPPSPAPVEHEHKFTPYYPGGDWNQCVECGLMKEIPPAPVESNPKSGETK
jgi:hypothetical protein